MTLLELKNIKKYFPVQKGMAIRGNCVVRAVNGVDLALSQGEHLSLVGESGCGKTTLGRIIIKLITPDQGRIYFQGENVSDFSDAKMQTLRKNIQMVFQDPYSSLDPRFTVRHVMREAMIFSEVRQAKEKDERACDVLAAVGLPKGDILNRYPHEFSGGERQRIAIARALAVNPKLLILDEAVSALDVLVQRQMMGLLKELQDQFGLTYFFISHNLRIVKEISHHIAVMYQGRIVEWARTQEIFENPLHPYTQRLLKAAMNYEVDKNTENISILNETQWVEKNPQHYVLE